MRLVQFPMTVNLPRGIRLTAILGGYPPFAVVDIAKGELLLQQEVQGRWLIYSNFYYICTVTKSEILGAVMSETGMTQSRLADLSGVKQPSISQMVHGHIEMSDEMLDRLLSCMGYRLEVVRSPVRVDLDRSSLRRWQMHQRLAQSLSEETWPTWRPSVVHNLKELRTATRGEPHVSRLMRWDALVKSDDIRSIRRVMTGLDTYSIQMRDVSPMGGLLSEEERHDVLSKLHQ